MYNGFGLHGLNQYVTKFFPQIFSIIFHIFNLINTRNFFMVLCIFSCILLLIQCETWADMGLSSFIIIGMSFLVTNRLYPK